jgi:hypothetical protein
LQNKDFQARFFFYRYLSNRIKENEVITGNNILVGNSAAITNNHLDILKLLEKHKISYNSNIIIPLSYAGDNTFKQFLLKKIKKSNQTNIKFLTDFISIDKYCNILNTCQYAIFGHIRQQAMGNIYRCLYQGSKVFLYEESVAYKYLKEQGYVIYAIEDINNYELNTPLSENEKHHNRKLYLNEANYDTHIKNLQKGLYELL